VAILNGEQRHAGARRSWLGQVKGALPFSLIVLNLCFWVAPLFLLALLKLLVPLHGPRRRLDEAMTALYRGAVRCDRWILKRLAGIRFQVAGTAGLRRDGWYLVIANHRSWFDIFALQTALLPCAPMVKFVVKRQLRWMPIVGLICWAYRYPLLRRHDRRTLQRHPEKRWEDVASLRRACETFRETPASVIIFAEGTRFTPIKRAQQQSPYANLLKPKAGGLSLLLQGLGPVLTEIVDATLIYPRGDLNFWDVLCGRAKDVRVLLRRFPLDAPFDAPPATPEAHYNATAAWINALWQEKDRHLAR